jgi:hypothetical protein
MIQNEDISNFCHGQLQKLLNSAFTPKGKNMEDILISAKAKYPTGAVPIELTLEEAERVGEEAKRKRAEIAKREEIGPGDWFIACGSIHVCSKREGKLVYTAHYGPYFVDVCRKLHPTPEVRSWLDKTIGGEG